MQNEASFFKEYSEFNAKIMKSAERLRVALQINSLLAIYLKDKKRNLKLLDIGASSGLISKYLSDFFGEVHAIDVDTKSIKFAKTKFKKKNLKFYLMDALDMKFPNESFDVIVCNQVYYCVKDPQKLMNEIFRVLKKGGICFFGARNKYTLWDAQYHLPLLSLLPQNIADWIVKTAGRSNRFLNNYRSFWQLLDLCRDFEIQRMTPKILNNAKKYGYKTLIKFQPVLQFIPVSFWERVEPVLPNFIWILRKPD